MAKTDPSTPEAGKSVYKPARKRYCTDILCLILFLAAWCGAGAIAGISVTAKPELIDEVIYPQDSYGGNFCGKKGTPTGDLPKLMYPVLDDDIMRNMPELVANAYSIWTYYELLNNLTGLCVASCPEGVSLTAQSSYGGADYPSESNASVPTFYYSFTTTEIMGRCLPLSSTFDGGSRNLCVTPNCIEAAAIPSVSSTVSCATIESRPDEVTTWEMCADGVSDEMCATQKALCEYEVVQESTDAFVPSDADPESQTITNQLAGYLTLVLGVYDGIFTAWQTILLFGVVLPILAGFAWSGFLALFAGLVIGLLLTLSVLSMLCFSLYLLAKAGAADLIADEFNVTVPTITDVYNNSYTQEADDFLSTSDAYSSWYLVFGLISLLITLIYIIFLAASYKAIRRAIAIVKESARVFRAVPVMIVWPLWQYLFAVPVLAFGGLIFLWLQYPETWAAYTDSEYVLWILRAYHLLVTLWTLQLIKAAVWTSMACVVAQWFISDAKDACCGLGIGVGKLAIASWIVFSKHLGSMAFGALLIAICQFLRLILTAIAQQTKSAQDKNPLLKLAISCVMCAMWCLQKSIEFISSYAFVFVGLEGTHFWASCKETFKLIIKYPAQAAVNGTVKFLLRLLIGLSTPILMTWLAWMLLDSDVAYTATYSALYPAAVVFVFSLIFADSAATVYICAIDTIFICCFQDMNNNTPPKHMSARLRKAFGIDVADKEAGSKADSYKSAADRNAGKGKAEEAAPTQSV